MRRVPALALTVLAAIVVPLTLTAPTPAQADAGSDAQFVADTNAARSANGLAGYAVAADLASLAARRAAEMAANHAIYHDSTLGSDVCCWVDLGENVGRGPSVSAVQQAFMDSPEHRANILSGQYTQIGVGTARGSDGALYVDELFRRPSGAAPAAGAPAAPLPVRAPAREASRGAMRTPLLARPSARVLLLDRIRLLLRQAALRHPERFDPLRRSLDYYGVMHQLTER